MDIKIQYCLVDWSVSGEKCLVAGKLKETVEGIKERKSDVQIVCFPFPVEVCVVS